MATDYALNSTFDIPFNTDINGVLTSLTGGTLAAYEDNSASPITTGLSLTPDVNGIAGLNTIRVVATGANGFSSGKNYYIILSAGSVGNYNAAGKLVGEFQINRFNVASIGAGGIATASFGAGAIDNTVIAANANTAIVNAVLAGVVEGTITLKQSMQLLLAMGAGKVSGGGTATITIRNYSDTVNAIVATVDANGNRSVMTYVFT
jgi:hypothetical protein